MSYLEQKALTGCSLFLFSSEKMQDCAENILKRDMELYSKLDISAKLWKIGHYPIIEFLRRRSRFFFPSPSWL